VAERVIIGVGASTGGAEAILTMMRALPADIPGMIIVQHMPPEGGFAENYARRLDKLCAMRVRKGRDCDEIVPGCAYIAPEDYHTRIVKSGAKYYLSCTRDPMIHAVRPSVDALFQSMAAQVSCHMVGIIMTGMGTDGAEGLLAMRRRGAYTIGQDRATSAVYGMPMEALRLGAVVQQSALENIAGYLMQHLASL